MQEPGREPMQQPVQQVHLQMPDKKSRGTSKLVTAACGILVALAGVGQLYRAGKTLSNWGDQTGQANTLVEGINAEVTQGNTHHLKGAADLQKVLAWANESEKLAGFPSNRDQVKPLVQKSVASLEQAASHYEAAAAQEGAITKMKVHETFRLYMAKMQECDTARARRSRAAAEMMRPFLDPSIKSSSALVAKVNSNTTRMSQASDAIVQLQGEVDKIKTQNPDLFDDSGKA